jgi:6-phospho-3-hexuloisomerase
MADLMELPAEASFARDLRRGVDLVLAENRALLDAVSIVEVEALEGAVRSGARLFVAGQGRSGLVARMAAMRFAHLGTRVHVVGETTTPAIQAGDWLIVVSGSGATVTARQIAQTARGVGARVLAVTAEPGSPLARGADAVVTLSAPVKTDHRGPKSGQFAGSLFEQGVLLLMDALFLVLSRGRGREELYQAHANLE